MANPSARAAIGNTAVLSKTNVLGSHAAATASKKSTLASDSDPRAATADASASRPVKAVTSWPSPPSPPSTESLAPSFRNDGPRAMNTARISGASLSKPCAPRCPAAARSEATHAECSALQSRSCAYSPVSPLAWSAFAEAFAPQSVQPTSAAITTGPTRLFPPYANREGTASRVQALTLGWHARIRAASDAASKRGSARGSAGSAGVDFASPSPFA